ncbi:MAG: hypothetical protein HQ546_03100 [Planctomycetes bacterium]|nr:hypothetical protein [Planctomycetota bacterium]
MTEFDGSAARDVVGRWALALSAGLVVVVALLSAGQVQAALDPGNEPGAAAAVYVVGDSSTGTPSAPQFTLMGDLDFDNDVDIFDWAVFQPNYGTMAAMTYDDGDLDGDADVDIFDWAIFQPNYGTSIGQSDLTPQHTEVPLPGAIVLGFIGLALVGVIKRKSLT